MRKSSKDPKQVKLLELFGGIGAPRAALRNLGVKVLSLGYVENDSDVVRSYNAIFPQEQVVQDVKEYSIRPDLLVHGSPCTDFSQAGNRRGGGQRIWNSVISNVGDNTNY